MMEILRTWWAQAALISVGILGTWWVQAALISVGTALTLNGAPFLPKLRDIRPRRIEARWVGYVGTFAALGLWLAINPHRLAWQAFVAYGAIWFVTLVVNTLIHLHSRDTKRISFLLTLEGQMLLEGYLREHPPDDPELAERFRKEQLSESAQERWEDVIASWADILGDLDLVFGCLIQAARQEPEKSRWLLTTIAIMTDFRSQVCRARNNCQLWYSMFWPKYAM